MRSTLLTYRVKDGDLVRKLDSHSISDFQINLNEAQRSSVIQTDSTE